jgi:hypothetical protein
LSANTLAWCEEALQALGHSGNPLANEFLPPSRHFLIPPWYRQLRIKARDHIESGEAPALSIAPKPPTAHEWQVRQQVIAEMRNEADTFGLIESGDVWGVSSSQEDGDISDEESDY